MPSELSEDSARALIDAHNYGTPIVGPDGTITFSKTDLLGKDRILKAGRLGAREREIAIRNFHAGFKPTPRAAIPDIPIVSQPPGESPE